MMRTRFYFSAVHHDLDNVVAVLAGIFGGATLYQGRGIWNGQVEPAYVLEVLGETDHTCTEGTARWLAETFGQSEVWYTMEPVEVYQVKR